MAAQVRGLRTAVTLALLIGSAAWACVPLVRINAWSRYVIHAGLPDRLSAVNFASAPAGHARAALWGGLAALAGATLARWRISWSGPRASSRGTP